MAPLPRALAAMLPDVYRIGFRSPALHWNFHPTDPSLAFVDADCAGRLSLRRRPRLVIEARLPTVHYVLSHRDSGH